MQEHQRQAIGHALRHGAWFGGLPPHLRNLILEGATLKVYGKGQLIQRENTPAPGLMAILEGRVAFLRHVGDKDPALIHVGGAGLWFGEMGLMIRETVLVTAVAQTPVRVLLLAKPAFERIVAADPRHYTAFASLAFQRYRLLLRYFAEMLRLSPEFRLRIRLADLAELQDEYRAHARRAESAVDLALSQTDLARIVGMSRQKLNVRLQQLREEGWVELANRRIRVLDPAGLRASAADGIHAAN
jgi:CRP/FNR family transcriptional regulator, cyclic AMP receptor protein